MPHASHLQSSFGSGEFSPKVLGRTDNERYKTGLIKCLNYVPTLQGPLVRRPGMKYVADAKDPAKPPVFIPFKFSQSQNYILEVGDQYIRFFTNNGQAITNTTVFKVAGSYGTTINYAAVNSTNFYATRFSPREGFIENVYATSVLASGAILEMPSPYLYPDVQNIKFAQKEDTLYLVNTSYPEYKLQRMGALEWDLKRSIYFDGPYLPVNTYSDPGDSRRWNISSVNTINLGPNSEIGVYSCFFGPRAQVSATASAGGLVRITTASKHNFLTGDKVYVEGIFGTTEANNGSSVVSATRWRVSVPDDTHIDLIDSAYTNAYVGSGFVYPAVMDAIDRSPAQFVDQYRQVGLTRTDGGRTFGWIQQVTSAAKFIMTLDTTLAPGITGSSAFNTVQNWFLSPWNLINGYPGAITFHQDRKVLAGAPGFPQQIDASKTSEYENFQSSGSSFLTADDSALSFTLASDQLNLIQWLKSDTSGLLAGATDAEWKITPNQNGGALTPTNFNAQVTSYFGSAPLDAVQLGNGTLYLQRGGRRIRELNYFFQVDTYRSTDLTELSDHITNSSITRVAVQKEPLPLVWALRNDGQLLSMTYNRDEATLRVGWAEHQVGGQSDSGGSKPKVKAIGVIPSPDGTFDQLWTATQRYINGTSVLQVEFMEKMYEDKMAKEDAFYVDCGATFDNAKAITGITIGSCFVNCASHGFSNGDTIKVSNVIGLNSSVIDSDGVIFNSNLVNDKTFLVGSSATNSFFLLDFNSSFIVSNSYSSYFSGGYARKLVSSISGFTWLKNEKVAVLADGGIHGEVIINSAGLLTLNYPVGKAQVGLPYKSDGKSVRLEAGSGDGTSIGKIRRPYLASFMLHNVGEFQIGDAFNRLRPIEFLRSDENQVDVAPNLFSGVHRTPLESEYSFDGYVCFRQSAPLPGWVQSMTVILEENDV